MALEVIVGKVFDMGVDGGVDSDFTYSSSNPSCLSIDAQGIATAVAPGNVVVSIVRKSDGERFRVPVLVKPVAGFSLTINDALYGEG